MQILREKKITDTKSYGKDPEAKGYLLPYSCFMKVLAYLWKAQLSSGETLLEPKLLLKLSQN